MYHLGDFPFCHSLRNILISLLFQYLKLLSYFSVTNNINFQIFSTERKFLQNFKKHILKKF